MFITSLIRRVTKEGYTPNLGIGSGYNAPIPDFTRYSDEDAYEDTDTEYDEYEDEYTDAEYDDSTDSEYNYIDGDYSVAAIDPSDVPILSSEDLVEIELDSNNTIALDDGEAFELGVIDTDFAGYVSEDLTPTKDLDTYEFTYEFTVDQNNDFNFVLDGLSSDVDLYLFNEDIDLFNEDIEILGSSLNSDSDPEALAASLEEGTYILSIENYDGDTTDYELTITSGDFA
ncbi:MAG: hypothetical protein HC939_24480 [Pleurocapsa sp. SU_5_0]|nr:hypothetical protein [Pleurocapsa sp. SU_5_0]